MRGRVLFSVVAVMAAACSSTQFVGDDSNDSGTVDPSGGDGGGGGAEAGPALKAPGTLTFVDQDPTKNHVAGEITLLPSMPETNVLSYAIYWASDESTLIGPPFATLKANGANQTYSFPAGTMAPDNANYIFAFAINDQTRSTASFALGDNYARLDDMSAVTVAASRIPLFIDSLDMRIGTLTLADSILCPTQRGAACTQTATTFAGLAGNGALSDAVFDAASQKILGFVSNASAPAQLLICGADGSGCTAPTLSSSLTSSANTAMIIDDTGGKLYMFVPGPAGAPTVNVCAHDGTGCTLHPVTANGGPTGAYQSPRLAIDASSHNLAIAVTDATAGMRQLSLLLCTLTFGASDACALKAISTDSDSGHNPSIVVDTLNSKLLIVTDYQTGSAFSASMYRCDLDGTNCSARIDLSASAGAGMGVDEFPSAVFDPDGAHLYVGTANSTNNTPTLYRCNPDGTSCTTNPLGPIGSGGAPTLHYDTTARRIYFAYPAATAPVFGSIATW